MPSEVQASGFALELWARAHEAVPLGASRPLLESLAEPVFVLRGEDGYHVARRVQLVEGGTPPALRVVAVDDACTFDRLGARDFLDDHRLRYPYVSGSMTQGIASVALVSALAREGMLGFFGAGGLPLEAVEKAIEELGQALPHGEPFGVNLINAMDPAREKALVDVFLRRGVRRIEAAAYLSMTPGLVRYRLHGARALPDGRIEVPNQIFGKCSREEIAEQFWSPPPPAMVEELRRQSQITDDEARLAPRVPIAQDVVAEADSAGHTDGRPALLLFPSFHVLRQQTQARHALSMRLRLGAAGGISTPQTVLAAFTLGADFVVTGSVNQACVEAGTSTGVKQALAQASMTDVAYAPSADMFEIGAEVQVLTRGLLFHSKARKLHELFQAYGSLDEVPPAQRAQLEQRVFKDSIENVWAATRQYLERVDPEALAKAERSPKLKMSLVFRWYLGLSSRWAIQAEATRKVDYQVFCGPSMGAFNRWVKGTFLEKPEERRVAEVARNLLDGALYLGRCQSLARQGVALPGDFFRVEPRHYGSTSP